MPGVQFARYYDPAVGQFLTVDPDVATTLSPYGYVSDDPVNSADPSGLCVWIGCWVQQQLNNNGLCTINQSNCGNSLIDSVPGFAGAGSAVYGWESPSAGYDYKTTSFGLPFFSFSITVTKDNSLFFGAGPSASMVPVSLGQRSGRIQLGSDCNSGTDSFVAGFGATGEISLGPRAAGVTVSIQNQDSSPALATEQGWGTPQAGFSDQYYWEAP